MNLPTRACVILAVAAISILAPFTRARECRAQEPAQVTATSPPDGADNVSAGDNEIVVEFDRDMQGNSYSWSKWGDLFPRVKGAPVWTTPRKCVLKVTLAPNRLYTFGVNGPGLTGFQDTNGQPAATRVFSFRTAAGGAAEPVNFRGSPENLEVFNALQTAVNEHYSHRDVREINWTQRFDSFRGRMLASRTEDELAFQIVQLLAETQDPHISMQHGSSRFGVGMRAVVPNFSSKVLPRAVENLVRVNSSIYTGTYSDGIVYVLIATWASERAADLSELAKIMDNAKNAPGVILDVRPNGGGNDRFCEAFAKRFLTEKVVYEKIRVRDASRPGGFTPEQDRVLEPIAGGPLYAGKVAVLMGPANMSSCEAFLLMMKQVKQARLIGQNSYGSSGNPQPYEIGAGITVNLPSWQALTPDGKQLEGNGITPDELIETKPADFETGDPVISAALKWLREGK